MFYDLSLLYFVSLDSLIGSVLIVTPILSSEFASLIFSVLLLQLVSVLFRYFCQIFFLCPHEASSFFHSFLFSFSHTFVAFFSYLISLFPMLTSLFWLSITKSIVFALVSSSDSSFNCCPSILSSSCCSIFKLLNTVILPLLFDH